MDLDLSNFPYTKGFAFFPYGDGVFDTTARELPPNCSMVVGQDFGSKKYVKNNSFYSYGDENMPTIRNFKKLSDVKMKELFFTNLFIGLRKEKSMIGMNPALKAKEEVYLNACFSFFEMQITYVNPRTVIILGKVPYNFICDKLFQPSFKVKTFKHYFMAENILMYNNIKIICIQHPSMWNSNVDDINSINTFLKP